MPNWCENIATFSHKDKEVLSKLANAFIQCNPFNTFVPIPDGYRAVEATYSPNEDELKEYEKRREELKQRYGYTTSYDFACGEWGTKWEPSCEIEQINIVTTTSGNTDCYTFSVNFYSAWTPPIEFYQHLIDDYGFDVDAHYFEGGLVFAGSFDSNGSDYYEFNSLEELPYYLIELFSLQDEIERIREETEAEQV